MQSLPNRCNAQQLVKITLVEGPDSKVGGYYQCAYGNMNCYHLNETGKVVDAGMNGQLLSMRVMMNDGTSCRFNGRVNDNAVLGGYSCYTGASQFEKGPGARTIRIERIGPSPLSRSPNFDHLPRGGRVRDPRRGA